MRIRPNVALSLAAALAGGVLLSLPARAVPMSSANYAILARLGAVPMGRNFGGLKIAAVKKTTP